ncbi:MAG: hypothetical protein KF773_02595 [Deltaproteobacteria bacterium]|nr:hypothetical protein [Deltaproteobacteria bacterium]
MGGSASAVRSAVTFTCGQCGAGLSFDGVRTQTCPYCASPNFVERPPAANQPDPMFAIPFAGDAAWAHARIAEWIGGRTVFARPAFKHAVVDEMRGVYLPAYLYSAVAHTDYTAQIGENYTETEEYETTDAQGNKKKETRTVTRTEYRPLSGRHIGYVTDVIVSASAGLPNDELERVEPYDMREMRRFAPALISGWITEEFSRAADACMRLSREEAVELVGERLRRFMPGDSYSDLSWRTKVQWETLDPMLVPVYVCALRYGEQEAPVRVVVNGQTGRITGKVPLSWWKILVAVIAGIAAIALIALIARHGK